MLEVLNILKEYGWKGLLLAVACVLIYKILSEWIIFVFDTVKKKLLERRQTRLTTHSFFNSINYFLNVEIYSINIFPDKPVRQNLARDLAYCSLFSLKESAEKMVRINHEKLAKNEWAFELRQCVNDMYTTFIEQCNKKGIPESVYLKYTEWYFERLGYLNGMIDKIAYSEDYPTVESKTSTLLMLAILFTEVTIHDCEDTLKELNGEITGLSYRGSIIEPLDH